jgi:hypothetical protein
VPPPFVFDRTWEFDVDPAGLWRVLSATAEYPRWWSWLRRFDAPDGLVVGEPARCVVRAPLPYSLAFSVTPVQIEPGKLIEADVDGDLRGRARLEVAEDGADHCTARLVWSVELQDRLLRPLARVARPVLEWGHEWVVATGVEQFRSRALSR